MGILYTGNPMKISPIIPAYNEGETIDKIIQETNQHVDTLFVVDDGSTDSTAKVAEQNGVEVIRHSVNLGTGAAQQAGYAAAISEGFDYIVQIDADAQHNPKYIPEMLSIAQSCDIVIASRFLNKSHQNYPFVRRLGISFFTFVVKLLVGVNITDVTCGYRVYKAESLRKLGRLSSRHWAVEQTLEAGKRGFNIKEISIEMPVRNMGKSQFSLVRYALYPFRMIPIIIKVMLFR